MNDSLFSAILAFLGTLIGTFSGILVNTKLMNYRIEQLELRFKELSDVGEKFVKLEGNDKLLDERIDGLTHRVDGLEAKVK